MLPPFGYLQTLTHAQDVRLVEKEESQVICIALGVIKTFKGGGLDTKKKEGQSRIKLSAPTRQSGHTQGTNKQKRVNIKGYIRTQNDKHTANPNRRVVYNNVLYGRRSPFSQ